MTKNPILNALAAGGYIVFIVFVIQAMMLVHHDEPDTILAPIMMISLFVLSAAIMGYVFLSQPVMLYLDGAKKEALDLFLKTIGFFACITVLFVLATFFVTARGGFSSSIEVQKETTTETSTPLNLSTNRGAEGYDVASSYFGTVIADANALDTKHKNPATVGVAAVDLNNDGQTEFVASVAGAGLCGSAGCPLVILMKRDDAWKNVLGGDISDDAPWSISSQSVALGSAYTKGMRDLVLSGFKGETVWKWDGQKYDVPI